MWTTASWGARLGSKPASISCWPPLAVLWGAFSCSLCEANLRQGRSERAELLLVLLGLFAALYILASAYGRNAIQGCLDLIFAVMWRPPAAKLEACMQLPCRCRRDGVASTVPAGHRQRAQTCSRAGHQAAGEGGGPQQAPGRCHRSAGCPLASLHTCGPGARLQNFSLHIIYVVMYPAIELQAFWFSMQQELTDEVIVALYCAAAAFQLHAGRDTP